MDQVTSKARLWGMRHVDRDGCFAAPNTSFLQEKGARAQITRRKRAKIGIDAGDGGRARQCEPARRDAERLPRTRR